MARGYRLGKRGQQVVEGRKGVIQAARRLVSLRGYQSLTVEAVADAAGVSRATVYNQFGSKQGILEAVFDDIGRRIEFARVLDAAADPDPRRAAWRLLTESISGWSRDRSVIRRILGLVAADPELANTVRRHELGRRKPIRALVKRLRADSALNSRVSDAEAFAALATLTSFTTYDLLASTGLRRAALMLALGRLLGAVVDFGDGPPFRRVEDNGRRR